MTIREMETVTGLTRANIRFYEAQGLIAPERKENNYREYSQTDGEVLLRIKLLRALGMTIEQIKAIQTELGDKEATDVEELREKLAKYNLG